MLKRILAPSLPLPIVLNFLDLQPSRLAHHISKETVIFGVLLPVKHALLEVALEAARADLLDVDVLEAVLGGVVLRVEVDGHGGDDSAL